MDFTHPFDFLLEIDKRNGSQVASSTAKATQSPGIEGRLALRLGVWNLLLSMQDVAEIIPFPPVTQVPGVKPWLVGLANSRGTVISVVDLREFLGGKPTVPTPNSRLVVVRSGEWSYGLLVDEVIGMRHFGLAKKTTVLEETDAGLRAYVTEVFESEGRKWMVFSVNRLLTATEFYQAVN